MNYNYLEEVLNNNLRLCDVPYEVRTKEFMLKLLIADKAKLDNVPRDLRNDVDLITAAIKYAVSDHHTIGAIPKDVLTQDLIFQGITISQPRFLYFEYKFLIETETLIKCLNAICKSPYINQDVVYSIIRQLQKREYPVKDWNTLWFPYVYDSEMRRQFLKHHLRGLLNHLTYNTLDLTNEYKLIVFKNFPNQKALMYHCPSSNDLYVTEVPPDIDTVEKAVLFLNNNVENSSLAYQS